MPRVYAPVFAADFMAVPGNFTSWPPILKHTELHRGHVSFDTSPPLLHLPADTFPTASRLTHVPPVKERSLRKETKIESGYRSSRLLLDADQQRESTGSNVPTTRRRWNLNDFHSVRRSTSASHVLAFHAALYSPPLPFSLCSENCFMNRRSFSNGRV